MSASQGHIYTQQHQLGGDALVLDLKEQVDAVIEEARQSNVGHAARTLAKDGPLRLTIIGFKAGATLSDHKAGGPVSIQVLRGSIDVNVAERSERLAEARTLVLGPGVEHSLVAGSEAVILLTVVMPA